MTIRRSAAPVRLPGEAAAPAGPTDCVARLAAVSKTYRMGEVEVAALDRVDLVVRHQRFTFLVGPSGSGKTTLLNLIGCIDVASSGRIDILGQDVSALGDDRLSDFRNQNVGYIFQSFNLIPVLTAFENVEYPLILKKTPRAEREELVMDMLDAVGLADRADHRPGQLSGGQRQRVAIARALAKQPALVLADEPTANLDSRTSGEIIELMKRMQERCRTTFVFCTHDRDLIRMADDIVVLRDGRLQ